MTPVTRRASTPPSPPRHRRRNPRNKHICYSSLCSRWPHRRSMTAVATLAEATRRRPHCRPTSAPAAVRSRPWPRNTRRTLRRTGPWRRTTPRHCVTSWSCCEETDITRLDTAYGQYIAYIHISTSMQWALQWLLCPELWNRNGAQVPPPLCFWAKVPSLFFNV